MIDEAPSSLKRILVLGCCGAGKSTFSKKLHQITGNEVIHLDQYYWQPDWREIETGEWMDIVAKLASGDSWIIDGNYRSTLQLRLARADAVVYFDFPTWVCVWRITKRILKYYGKVRPDMPEGCKERFDRDFYHYVLTYNLRQRREMLDLLDQIAARKTVSIFRNDHDSERFLRSFGNVRL